VAGWVSGMTDGETSGGSKNDNSPVHMDGSANSSPELDGTVLVGGNNSLVLSGGVPVGGNDSWAVDPSWLFDGGGGGASSSGSSMRGGASS